MEHQAADDELVYPVFLRAVPSLRFTRHLSGKKSLRFEGLLARMLLDSGAIRSFVSAMYLQDSHICYEPVVVPNATWLTGRVSTWWEYCGISNLKLVVFVSSMSSWW
jgi:hypothetical protein